MSGPSSSASLSEAPVAIENVTVQGTARHVARPCSEADLTELLAFLRGELRAGRIAGATPIGSGSRVARHHPTRWSAHESEIPQVWIDMTALVPANGSGILEYVPGDGTLTAQAGADMGALRAAVAEGGHRITPASPGQGTTLGGLLASGDSSLDRCAFGPTRHHVLGMRIQDASGRGPTRSGGRLVKNVTGFDLHRLHAGSRGTLGAILEASLRLVPIPEAETLLVSKVHSTATQAADSALELRRLPSLHPRAIFIVERRVHLVLSGRARQVEAESAAARSSMNVEHSIEGPSALEEALGRGERSGVLRLATAPSRLSAVLAALGEISAITGDQLAIEPDAALVDIVGVDLEALDAPSLFAGLARLDASAFHLSLLDPTVQGAPGWSAALRERQAPPAAIERWSQRLAESFDPDGLLRSPDFPAFQPAR
ncbi:MAG: FAD-binding oxidoreductase [Planctomycetota bacterium]